MANITPKKKIGKEDATSAASGGKTGTASSRRKRRKLQEARKGTNSSSTDGSTKLPSPPSSKTALTAEKKQKQSPTKTGKEKSSSETAVTTTPERNQKSSKGDATLEASGGKTEAASNNRRKRRKGKETGKGTNSSSVELSTKLPSPSPSSSTTVEKKQKQLPSGKGCENAIANTTVGASGGKTETISSRRKRKKAQEEGRGAKSSSAKRGEEIVDAKAITTSDSKMVKSSSKPQISVQVHRFRSANYIPRSILKLCATPCPSSFKTNNNRQDTIHSIVPHLAVSREGGSVELVSVDEKWKCVGVVEGLKKRNVDAMAWICPGVSTTSSISSDSTSAIVLQRNGNSDDDNDDDPAVLISDESESGQDSNSSSQQYFSHKHELAEQIQSKRKLFGASRDGTIFEIDFKTKTHVGVIGSGGGAVFCLEGISNNGTNSSTNLGWNLLAAGCEDGSVRIFKSLDRQKMKMNASGNVPSMELISTLPSVGCAVTSVAWISPPSTSSSSTQGLAGSVLYAGVADGTIRKFVLTSTEQNARATGSVPHAMSTGMMLSNSSSITDINDKSSKTTPFAGLQWKATARLTVENQGKRIATKIWSLKALNDGTIVSGDSMGNIQFWDGNTGTLLQSIEHNKNDADVLDLAVSLDQNKIMASGIDSRVVCLEYDALSKTSKKWILTTQQRSHTHDVNSMAMVYMTDATGCAGGNQSTAKPRELLCSGGVDTKVCSYLVSNMRKYRPKIAYKYPSNAPVALSKKRRTMSIMRPDRVDIYQLRPKVADTVVAGGAMALDEEKAHLGSVRISSTHNLISFDVNDDGTLLAASHAAGIYLFSLEYLQRFEDGEEQDSISRMIVKPTRIDVPTAVNASCSSIKFSKKDPNLLICAHCNGMINVLSITQDSETRSFGVSINHSFKDEGNYRRNSHRYPITQVDISPDGQWIAAGRNTIGKGCLNVYSLSPTYRHWWTIPCTEAPLACIKWLGDGSVDPTLAVSLNNSVFYLFDVRQKCLSDWSQDLGFPASPNLPKELSQSRDCPDRFAFNPSTPSKFLMVSS